MDDTNGYQGISLDRLFRICKIVDMPDNTKVRVRSLSDLEMQDRNRAAIAARYVAEKRLKDKGSVEYQATLLPMEDAGADELKASLLAYRKFEIEQESYEEFKRVYIPDPKDATDEEKLATLAQREASLKDTEEKRKAWVQKKLESYAEGIDKWEEAKLRKEGLKKTAEFFGREAYSERLIGRTLFTVVSNLDGTRFFESEQEVTSVPPGVVQRLYDAVVEVNSLDPLSLPGPSATV